MTDCDRFLELLAGEPEGLAPAAGTALREHLAACGSCGEAREDLKALRRLAASRAVPVSESREDTLAGVRGSATRVVRRDWMHTVAAVAAGVLLAVLLMPAGRGPVRAPAVPRLTPDMLRAYLTPEPSPDSPILREIPTSDPNVTITIAYKPFNFPSQGGRS